MSEEIHDLISKYLSGQASAEETAQVEDWAGSSEANKAEFILLQKLWVQSGESTPVIFDTQKAWIAVNARIKSAPSTPKLISLFPRKAIAIAAASVIVVIAAWWVLGSRTSYTKAVAETGMKELLLNDGTKVYLRKGASLEYPTKFKTDKRNVSLTGEAFFEVTPDAAKPFLIAAGESEVKVLGTSFTVHEQDSTVEVIVQTGKVQFSSKKHTTQTVVVMPGEKAVLAQDAISKNINADENFHAWQTKQLVFLDTPLQQVAAALSDFYAISISLNTKADSTIGSARITTSFNNQSLQSVLHELSLITSFQIKKLDQTHYEISSK